jgi:hypothetical protein
MPALDCGDVSRRGSGCGQARDAVDDLFAGALTVEPAGVAHGAKHQPRVGKLNTGGVGYPCRALLGTAMTAAVADVASVGPLLVSAGQQRSDRVEQVDLVVFQREQVVAAGGDDRRGGWLCRYARRRR